MPSNATTNYQLNQWSAEDQVRRIDFNADNAKIDAAIKAVDQRADALSAGKADQTALNALSQTVAQKAEQSALDALSATVSGHTAALAQKGNCRIAAGTYTGTGTCGQDNPITLDLGFAPKLVIAHNVGGAQFDSATSGYQERTLLILARPSQRFYTYGRAQPVCVTWTDQGVSWYCAGGATSQLNDNGAEYLYVAIG